MPPTDENAPAKYNVDAAAPSGPVMTASAAARSVSRPGRSDRAIGCVRECASRSINAVFASESGTRSGKVGKVLFFACAARGTLKKKTGGTPQEQAVSQVVATRPDPGGALGNVRTSRRGRWAVSHEPQVSA